MSDGKDPAYEDSYEKYERLTKELEAVYSEIKQFLEVLKKDFAAVGEVGGKLNSMDVKMAALGSDEIILEAELRNIESGDISLTASLDDKIDAEAAKFEKIDAQRKKIAENLEKQFELFKEMDEAVVEEVGRRGDSDGTFAIIQMKIARMEEIHQEIADIEKE